MTPKQALALAAGVVTGFLLVSWLEREFEKEMERK